MTAKEFWKDFLAKIEQRQEELKRWWREPALFTDHMRNALTEIIRGRNPSNEFIVQPEYFNIDLTGWEQKKRCPEEHLAVSEDFGTYRLKKYAWNFDIAIEHENDKSLWMDEVIKLAYIFCDLRIVIGYFPYVKEDKIGTQQRYLDAICDTIKTLKCHENMNHGEFMIILGDVASSKAEGFKELVYTPYLYSKSEGKFKLLVE